MICVMVLAFILAGCTQNPTSSAHDNMTEPPVRIHNTLEEQFDEANAKNTDGGTVVSITRAIPFPTELPTEGISFSTPDRFSINYSLQIAVEDTLQVFESLNEVPSEFKDTHIISTKGGTTYEVTIAVDESDLEGVLLLLFTKGVVEEYRVTIWDMGSADRDDDFEWWQARWDENNTIVIIIVEAGT